MYKKYLFLIPVIFMAACGFHLRGSQSSMAVNISSVYLQSANASRVESELRKQLQQTNTPVSATSTEAEYTVKLAGENMDRSVLSVSATSGKVEKYKLTYSVLVSIMKGEEVLVSGETVRVIRDYTFDESAVLGKTSEEQLIQEAMIRNASSQIIRRLIALARS